MHERPPESLGLCPLDDHTNPHRKHAVVGGEVDRRPTSRLSSESSEEARVWKHTRVYSVIISLTDNMKKLYRNTEEAILGGVLSGMADYYEQDVVLWRLAAIVLLILTGLMPGVLIYLVAWVIIPAKPKIEPVDQADYTVYS